MHSDHIIWSRNLIHYFHSSDWVRATSSAWTECRSPLLWFVPGALSQNRFVQQHFVKKILEDKRVAICKMPCIPVQNCWLNCISLSGQYVTYTNTAITWSYSQLQLCGNRVCQFCEPAHVGVGFGERVFNTLPFDTLRHFFLESKKFES